MALNGYQIPKVIPNFHLLVGLDCLYFTIRQSTSPNKWDEGQYHSEPHNDSQSQLQCFRVSNSLRFLISSTRSVPY